ncbi:MAG: radical SAM protein [Dysosmobacter sp.]|nr:radical SAM protein [Dysosmobacter sp.]
MHFYGTIWKPPYEADSLLLQAAAGCTHHACKFCTLYEDLPFRFRMSPLEEIEADLREAQLWSTDPVAMLAARLQSLPRPREPRRVFLVGANPFVLRPERLEKIAGLIRQYLPAVESIGCFARVTDVGLKSGGELRRLRALGYDGLTIGVETGDEEALAFMNKGYRARDIVEQAGRLDEAGISYSFFYLAGISGAGRGEEGARRSAEVFNRTHPKRIGSSMLTVFPDSELYREIQAGNWKEESELEKLGELKTLIQGLNIPTRFETGGASNLVHVRGALPREREALAGALERLIAGADEESLRAYRVNLKHL